MFFDPRTMSDTVEVFSLCKHFGEPRGTMHLHEYRLSDDGTVHIFAWSNSLDQATLFGSKAAVDKAYNSLPKLSKRGIIIQKHSANYLDVYERLM